MKLGEEAGKKGKKCNKLKITTWISVVQMSYLTQKGFGQF